MDLKKILADNIWEILEQKKNMKLKELAEDANIPINTMNKISRGKHMPSFDKGVNIAKALEVPAKIY